MIQVSGVTKGYQLGKETTSVLKGIDLTINKGEFVSIMGPSGSGKSTLLNVIGGLDQPDSGVITVGDEAISRFSERQMTLFRRRNIGFVFQNYQLLPTMTVEENIAFPMHADRRSKKEIATVVTDLLEAVQLTGKERHFPSQLSGGQQQRVAIARALAMQPQLILADEPTGNLDRKIGTDVLRLLASLHKNYQLTIVMVTHDMYSASYSDRIILLKDGQIEMDVHKGGGGNSDAMATILAKLNS